MVKGTILLTVRASTALNLFIETADAHSRSEYGLPLEALVNELDTDRGRLRYGRLMGVMLKEPFADRFVRSGPSEATGAAFDWCWNEQKVKDADARLGWQYLILKNLVAQKYAITEPIPEDVYRFIWYEGCAEGRILKYVLEATHQHLCGNDKARREIKAAVQKARMEGARVADPSRTNLVAGIGTVVTTLVAVSGTYGVALGPLAGGLSILIAQIGLDAFCMWSQDKIEDLRATEKAPEIRKLMRMYHESTSTNHQLSDTRDGIIGEPSDREIRSADRVMQRGGPGGNRRGIITADHRDVPSWQAQRSASLRLKYERLVDQHELSKPTLIDNLCPIYRHSMLISV